MKKIEVNWKKVLFLVLVLSLWSWFMYSQNKDSFSQTTNSINAGFPVTILSAAATGAGTIQPINGPVNKLTWQIVVTGAPTTVAVNLEGSIDGGANWFVLDSSGTTTVEMRHIVNKTVMAVRANLTTLTGGTTPTVTVVFVAGT